MGMNLAKQVFNCEPDYFIAGANFPIQTSVKAVAAAIDAHAPVALNADGKLVAVTKTGDAITTGIYGITAEAASAADEEVVVYISGEFFADALKLDSSVTAADVEIAFRNIGIFLK